MNVSSRVTIDWEGSKLEWVNEARRALLPCLFGDERFQDAAKMERRFEEEVSAWQARQAEPRSFRGVINIGNELAAAVSLLDKCKDLALLRYEPPMKGTGQTLDFCLRDAAGHPVWIDVKTVAPQWQDDDEGWQRFKALAAEFPDNVRFGVQRAFGGAGIFGQAIKARWSFVMRTIEIEKKVELIPRQDSGRFGSCSVRIGSRGTRTIWKTSLTFIKPAAFARTTGQVTRLHDICLRGN